MTKDTPNQMANLEMTYSTLCEYQHIHNKAIFDAINEALDKHRPYGLKGCPPLWSSKTKTLTNNSLIPLSSNVNSKFNLLSGKGTKGSSIQEILGKVKGDIREWSNYFAGTLPNSELLKLSCYEDNDSSDLKQIAEDRLC